MKVATQPEEVWASCDAVAGGGFAQQQQQQKASLEDSLEFKADPEEKMIMEQLNLNTLIFIHAVFLEGCVSTTEGQNHCVITDIMNRWSLRTHLLQQEAQKLISVTIHTSI